MAKTRQIRKRIISVKNIHKITATMEKVAQSKGMKLTGRYGGATSFRASLERLLPEALGVELASPEAAYALGQLPLGAHRAASKRVLLFGVTSSRGLCGGYNARVVHALTQRMAELAREGREAALAVLGRKGLAYFRYHGVPVAIPVPDVDENIPFQRVDELVQDIMGRFLAGEFDAVEVISTRYKTKLLQEVQVSGLLPLALPVSAAAAAPPTQGPDGNPLYLVEPDRGRVLSTLLPLIAKVEVFCRLLEAMLCEQAQRSLAMRSASDNANAMTKRLTRTFNRARQAQITNEMIEIISGSEGGRT
jgi:F-type H+-transporting ATPase subunit gamma